MNEVSYIQLKLRCICNCKYKNSMFQDEWLSYKVGNEVLAIMTFSSNNIAEIRFQNGYDDNGEEVYSFAYSACDVLSEFDIMSAEVERVTTLDIMSAEVKRRTTT